jgi:hypothetical protein
MVQMMGSAKKWQTVSVSTEKRMKNAPSPSPSPSPVKDPKQHKKKPALTRRASSSVACSIQ